MKEAKCGISLTGVKEFLLSLGGFRDIALQTAE